MSTLQPVATATTGGRTRRICMYATVVVLLWSLVEVFSLAVRHTNGAEIYGVMVAVLAFANGVASFALIRSARSPIWATAAVLIVWAVIALGGIAGVVAHIVGPLAGHGPVDLRPRPLVAPLIFTTLALVGGAAVFIGQRARRGMQEGDTK
jgi:peptidoglycan/LPS O-acetylase OafA/YrhL